MALPLRIKSHWNKEGDHSLEEIAGAIAYISWRLAQTKAINLHGEDFIYENDQQRMAVIMEYLIFQLQIVDRIARQELKLNDEDRQKLVIATARKQADIIQDNSIDLFGEGDYITPFFAQINQRGAEYAEYQYTEDGPTYPFYRHLGYEIQQIMGESQENRWVIDQVMDVDGPEVNRRLAPAVRDLFE